MRIACLDTAILRTAALHHVHPRQQLDACRHGGLHAAGNLVNRVQHAINTETHHSLITAGFQMNVTGALLKSILPQPVHQLHHPLVVGVKTPVPAEINELLETGNVAVSTASGRSQNRLGKGIKLGGIARNVLWIAHHQLHPAPCLTFDLAHPVSHKRF